MNLNQQCVREVPTQMIFEGFETDRAQANMHQGGFMFKNVHAIVMLSLRCFERLFTKEGSGSEVELNPLTQNDPYLESLLKLIPR